MDEEAAFLRAICENPDDDTPRLAFADWLAEQGGAVNNAWANGIRAQVWLARGATDEALRFQTCVFDSGYGQEKLRERLDLPSEVVDGWERGFPSTAAGHFQSVRRAWPRLAFRIPIRKLSVYEAVEGEEAQFVAWPALEVLSELEFAASWRVSPTADALSSLANCESLRGLKSLTVRYAIFSESTVTTLLDSPHLAGLTTLRLDIESETHGLSQALKDRLVARFGAEVFDPSIPF
jgi:uncharacterized protein (TIGR02996 family)